MLKKLYQQEYKGGHIMSMRIYTMTHKKFTPLPDPLYVPLHVGRA